MKLERGSVLRPAELLVSSVVVGVDGSEAGYEACRQAARLTVPGSSIELVCAVDVARVVHAGFSASTIVGELAAEGTAALEAAAQSFAGRPAPELVEGGAVQALLRTIGRTAATLLVVGSHGHRRAAEIVLGGVSGELLHVAPCSVLVSRATAEPALVPRAIVAGVDGSPESARA
ncbi:MAG: universal stress protein, partial [Gaiellaceae bacterium]